MTSSFSRPVATAICTGGTGSGQTTIGCPSSTTIPRKPKSHIVTFAAGKLSEGKGWGLFNVSIGLIRRPGIEFWAVGRDVGEPADPRIFRFGWLDSRQLMAVLQLSDVVVTPSTHAESFGRVAWDCSFLGIPVVATARGGMLDVIIPGQTGLIFDPVDGATGLANMIDAALECSYWGPWRNQVGVTGQLTQEAIALYETARKKQ